MKRKNFLLVTVILLSASLCAYSLSLEGLVGSAHAEALLAGERPLVVQTRNPQPQLLPQHQFSRALVESVMRDLNPAMMVETLHLYERPSPAAAWSDDEKARLFNNLVALSTLTGLEYFSASRGAMRIFYDISTVIDGPSTRNPIPDPVFPRPEPALTIYARQRDLTFGDNIYQYDYFAVPGGIIFVQQNLTPLRIGFITAVASNNLRSVVAILDAGNYILVYAASMANTQALPGFRNRIGNSFANRAEAILAWFRAQADEAFRE